MVRSKISGFEKFRPEKQVADVVSPEVRSRMMSGIRGGDTRPELALRRALHRLGFRYRLHDRKLPGRPDLVFPGRGAVVFVHGCFWHRHAECRFTTSPKTNGDFWLAKFAANVARDERATQALHRSGWRVMVAWECQLRPDTLADTVAVVARWLRQRGQPDHAASSCSDSTI